MDDEGRAYGIVVSVAGRPRTKGSLKPVHVKMGPGKCRVSLTESGEYAEAWKKEMIRAVKLACVVTKFPGAVIVDTFFRFDELCAADVNQDWPVTSSGIYAHGDEDKLRRNALDALTQSGLIADDALVIGGLTRKRYVEPGESGCGALIVVRPAMLSDLAESRDLEVRSVRAAGAIGVLS